MRDPVTHEPHTAHTTNRVPLMLVGAARRRVYGMAAWEIWHRPCSP